MKRWDDAVVHFMDPDLFPYCRMFGPAKVGENLPAEDFPLYRLPVNFRCTRSVKLQDVNSVEVNKGHPSAVMVDKRCPKILYICQVMNEFLRQ